MNRWLKISIPAAAILFLFLVIALKRSNRNLAAPSSVASTLQNGFLNLAPEVKSVGDEECAVCHAEIFKTYKQTGMGRSFYPPAEANLIEDYVRNNHVFDAQSNFHYQMVSKGGEFYQTEYRLDENGQRLHELTRRVDFVIGSGNHARTYLTNENGFLYELPVTWYNEKGAWGMSPGFRYVNYRFSRPITPGCMNCHNAYAEYMPYSGNRYAEVPHGIGCERCHGPGELHVAKRYQAKFADSTKKEIDYTIVNPRHLPVDLQMEVCRQCHLQGEVRVLKEGKQDADFRPGMRLSDVRSVYVSENLSPGDFRVASHGERISLSACYIKSGGKLTCITCHNPHQPVKWRPREFFNNTCQSCHHLETLSQANPRAKHPAWRGSSDCVACHMPQGGTSDVVHVNFTDHWIQKEPQAARNTLASTEAKVMMDFFEEKDSAADLRLGIAYLQYFEEIERERSYLDRALELLVSGLENNPGHEQGLYHLGKAYVYLDRLDEARQQFKKLAEIAPENALAHFQLGQVLSKMERPEAAISAYLTSLNIFPENAIALANLGNIHARSGDQTAALDFYQKASLAQPGYVAVHNNMGEFYAYKQHDPATARKHFLRALNLDPDHIVTLNNLGNIEMSLRNYSEATKFFARVIALDPRFVPAYGNLASIHFLQGRNREAMQFLRQLLKIDPHNLRAKNMLEEIESAAGVF